MVKKIIVVLVIVILGAYLMTNRTNKLTDEISTPKNNQVTETLGEDLPEMAIEVMRQRDYPGSKIIIEETLGSGVNYERYIASYISEGNKIYGLLTIPEGERGQKFPIIAFIHGYIAPSEYKTTERYVAYQDGLARNGFITFKIDLRGHGKSEGEAVNSHFSDKYVVDTINAINSLKMLEKANADRVGIWGHSNGGEIGLRTMTVTNDVDAGVFWAGVVGSFEGMLETYNSKIPFLNLERNIPEIVKINGKPSENPEFWQKIDPYAYLVDIKGAIQLHHGTRDVSVPMELSRLLRDEMVKVGGDIELYEYEGADHNLSAPAFSLAMDRTIEFFRQNLVN